MLTVHFEDHGQDFLEWDIEEGYVIGCRPYQGWVWNGTTVHNADIQAGSILRITTNDGVERTLNYPVERVEEKIRSKQDAVCSNCEAILRRRDVGTPDPGK